MKQTVATGRTIELHGGSVHLVSDPTQRIIVSSDPILVGRSPACHLAISDPRVSATHAELVATPTGVRLRDLGSKNGTWVGSARIEDCHLADETTFSVGPVEIAFEPRTAERVKLPAGDRFHDLYGGSSAMREVFLKIEKGAKSEVVILIEGETGTGKELLANSIHRASHRAKGPFVVLDCAGLSPNLAEAQLFGHVRGAFTGAVRDVTSPFVEANGGTLFLDELGELPLELQPKLLRALAERRVKPVGSETWQTFDARIVAATRRDLLREVNGGTFRSDLYFRVAALRVTVPSLRDRPDDIPGLVRVMLERMGKSQAYKRITRESMARLLRYDWPGNVRELKNVISVAVAMAEDRGPIDVAAHLGLAEDGAAAWTSLDYHSAKREALARFEKAYFSALVEQTDGNIAEISRRAGLQRTHVRKYVRTHALKR